MIWMEEEARLSCSCQKAAELRRSWAFEVLKSIVGLGQYMDTQQGFYLLDNHQASTAVGAVWDPDFSFIHQNVTNSHCFSKEGKMRWGNKPVILLGGQLWKKWVESRRSNPSWFIFLIHFLQTFYSPSRCPVPKQNSIKKYLWTPLCVVHRD